MLSIRREQVFVFEEDELDAYVSEAIVDVHQCWPRLCHRDSDNVLRGRMRRHAHAAATLGLTHRGDWLRYLNIAIAVGDDFATLPEARGILGTKKPAALRLNLLVRWAQAELRGR